MGANLNDNNAKLDDLEKSIRAANERRRKLIEQNKLITYSTIADLYCLEGQELIDAVTAEHTLIAKLKASGMSDRQIEQLGSSANKQTSFFENTAN